MILTVKFILVEMIGIILLWAKFVILDFIEIRFDKLKLVVYRRLWMETSVNCYVRKEIIFQKAHA